MSREAMQIALAALEANLGNWAAKTKAVEVLRQALKTEQESICAHGVEKTKCDFCQPKQEPVAHIDHRIHGWPDCFVIRADPPHTSPLYLSLPKREWVGLTDEEVSYFEYQATFCDELDTTLMAELIEQALKKKNKW